MAVLDAEHSAGLHLNMPIAGPPPGDAPLTDEEQADLATMARFQRHDATYTQLPGTHPQTLGIALDDSPAGLLAWIAQRFRDWSDCDGDLPHALPPHDQLLTNVMLYWVTRSFTSSARLFWETMHSGVFREPLEPVDVPTGIARYPKEEILRFPRSWVEQRYRVTQWTDMPRGGHFAAMEEPELFVDDLRHLSRTIQWRSDNA